MVTPRRLDSKRSFRAQYLSDLSSATSHYSQSRGCRNVTCVSCLHTYRLHLRRGLISWFHLDIINPPSLCKNIQNIPHQTSRNRCWVCASKYALTVYTCLTMYAAIPPSKHRHVLCGWKPPWMLKVHIDIEVIRPWRTIKCGSCPIHAWQQNRAAFRLTSSQWLLGYANAA